MALFFEGDLKPLVRYFLSPHPIILSIYHSCSLPISFFNKGDGNKKALPFDVNSDVIVVRVGRRCDWKSAYESMGRCGGDRTRRFVLVEWQGKFRDGGDVERGWGVWCYVIMEIGDCNWNELMDWGVEEWDKYGGKSFIQRGMRISVCVARCLAGLVFCEESEF